MKRILFLHQASTIGGGSYCLLNVVKTVDRSQFVPVVALSGEGPLADELRKIGVEVLIFREMIAIPYNGSLLKIRNVLTYCKVARSIPAFKRLLAENDIDVVYLNNMMIYRYLRPAKECGCKTILHVREHWPLDEHTTQLGWARETVNKYCDKLIAINRYSASIFPDKTATIVYDWIDMASRYEERPLADIFGEDMTGKKVYLFTGGRQRIKGTYEVLDAFKNQIKDPNARLLVLGYDSAHPTAGFIGLLKQILFACGFDINELKCKQIIDSDARIKSIPATYNITHIIEQSYCMVSYFTIPHANLALAESLIVGTPVVAADTDEAREYSLDGSLASLFPILDRKAFADALLNTDFEKMRADIQASSHVIAEMFDPQRNVDRLKGIYDEVLTSGQF